ncbi:MAG: sarcosine oxidase subunit gamma family protein [Pseudomonadota bacterium]
MPEVQSTPHSAVLSAPMGTAGRVIEGHVRVIEAGVQGMVSVKTDLALPALDAVLREVCGVGVPMRLTVWSSGDRAVVWMAPDELLVLVPAAEAGAVAGRIEAALGEAHALVADMSSARTLFRLEGARAGEVLAKGAPLDFRDAGFAVGTARRTHLGPVAVGIWREAAEAWSLVCFRSYAPYTADWLAAAVAEGSEVGHF